MADGELMTPAEMRRLEAEADALLRSDAEKQGFIRPNGRGFSEYARATGITTKKTLETTFKHEKVGFSPEQLDSLAAQPIDRRSTRGGKAPD